jgi:hypothetical protein
MPYLAFKRARPFSGLSNIKRGVGALHMEHLNLSILACVEHDFVKSLDLSSLIK